MFCLEQVARLAARHDEIRARGAKLYAIGNGSVALARAFQRELTAPLPLFTDPSRAAYRAFALRRGVLSFLRPALLKAGKRAARGGFRQTGIRGDALQLGGVLVMSQQGEELYRHEERFAGDLADLDEVLEALGDQTG